MYKVELSKRFTGDRRNRAGITVTRTEVYEGDLDKDQLDAVKADTELVVTEVKEAPSKAAAKPKSKKA